MGMEAFGMNDAYLQGCDPGRPGQGRAQSPRSVFAEHQVLAVGQGECLFIGAFDGGLHSGAEGCFGLVYERLQRQFLHVSVKAQSQSCHAALAVWRCDNAIR